MMKWNVTVYPTKKEYVCIYMYNAWIHIHKIRMEKFYSKFWISDANDVDDDHWNWWI